MSTVRSQMSFKILVSTAILLAFAACSSPTEPVPGSNDLMPLVGAQSSFQVTGYDSLMKSPINGVWEEDLSGYFANYQRHSFLWDSVSNVWTAIPFIRDAQYLRASGYGEWSQALIFTPYHDASGDGVLGGLDFLDSGAHYWFKLPQHFTNPLTFRAHSLVEKERGYTVGGDYVARLDTALFNITVPAGTYSCNRLLLSFDGQIGVGATVYLHSLDTIYMARGVGVVRHTLNEERLEQSESDSSFYSSENSRMEFNLKSRTTE